MAITLSAEDKDKILELQSKVKYANNKIKDLQAKKQAEILTAEGNHNTAISMINDSYDPQISTLQTDITDLTSQLEAVK